MVANFHHRFEPSLNLFIERYIGDIDANGALESSLKAAETVAEFVDPGHRVDSLLDMSDSVPHADLYEILQLIKAWESSKVLAVDRWAIFAPTSIQFGIARVFQLLSDNLDSHRQLRIFTDLSKARDWLGLPADFELGVTAEPQSAGIPPKYRHRFEPSLNLYVTYYLEGIDIFAAVESSIKAGETVTRVFGPGHRVDGILDLTEAKPDVGFEQMNDLVAGLRDAPGLRTNRLAVIAPKPFLYGLARMFQMLSDNSDFIREMRIFSKPSDALAWLGLPADFELNE